MDYRYLGPLEVVDNGGEQVTLGSPKQRMLLAVLLLNADRPVSMDSITDALWGDSPPRSADHSIHIYVSRLRKALAGAGAASALETVAPGYRLAIGPSDLVDGRRFESQVHDALKALDAGDQAPGIEALEQALDLWRGEPFADVLYEEFLQPEVRRLREIRTNAVERLSREKLGTGEGREAIPLLQQLADEVPFDESVVRLLARALYGEDRHAEALRCLHAFRARLGSELGMDPSDELASLEEQMLLHDPRLLADQQPRPIGQTSVNPYKGLHPFLEADVGDFFGRDGVVDDLVTLLAGGAEVISLVGPSGCGKTSVVMAGLLPQLRKGAVDGSDAWPIAVMTPGDRPFAALISAVRGVATRPRRPSGDGEPLLPALLEGVDGGLFLVIDQFEELFALNDGETQVRFLCELLETIERPECHLRLLTAMRADFFDRPLNQPAFGRRYTDGVVHLFPLSAEELEAAIVEPARRQGVGVEPALLATLVADGSRNPGALPLFEYALTELFDHRSGPELSLEDYDAVGRLDEALSRRAEALYQGLDALGAEAARQLFLRLVTVTDHVVTRRRVTIAELLATGSDPVAMQAVLDAYGRHRLIVLDRDLVSRLATVEVAHESLLEAWPRMREWIDIHRRDLQRYQALQADARDWVQSARHPDFLLSGDRLQTYVDWSQGAPMRLTVSEREYLAAGEEARWERVAVAAAQQSTTLKYRRRWWATATLLFLLVAVVAVTATVLMIGAEDPARVGALFGREATDDDSVAALVDAAIGRAVTEHGVEPVTLVTGASSSDWGLRTASVTLEEGLMILPGGGPEEAVAVIARSFPAITYVLIDSGLLGPNVLSVNFAEEQGGYLVGVAAALKTKTRQVGFIGGRPERFVDQARAGFEAGVEAIDPGIDVVAHYLYDPDAIEVAGAVDQWAWYYAYNWPEGAELAAAAMYRSGVDVIFVVAGGSSDGVFAAAYAEQVVGGTKLWVIGHGDDDYVRVRESWKPHVLTSSVKHTDVVVSALIGAYAAGDLQPGSQLLLDVADDAIGYATSGGYVDDVLPELEVYRLRLASGEIVARSWLPGRSLG